MMEMSTNLIVLNLVDDLLLAQVAEPTTLTPAGWGVMLFSVGAVIVLLSYCLTKVFSLPPVEFEEHVKGPLEIDTHDQTNAD